MRGRGGAGAWPSLERRCRRIGRSMRPVRVWMRVYACLCVCAYACLCVCGCICLPAAAGRALDCDCMWCVTMQLRCWLHTVMFLYFSLNRAREGGEGRGPPGGSR